MSKKPVVLVIEDNEQLRETIQMIIESTGREAWLTRTGDEALSLLGQRLDHLPALIVMDMTMPEHDGLQFMSKKALDPRLAGIPVVVFTSVQQIEFPSNVVKLRREPMNIQNLLEDMEASC